MSKSQKKVLTSCIYEHFETYPNKKRINHDEIKILFEIKIAEKRLPRIQFTKAHLKDAKKRVNDDTPESLNEFRNDRKPPQLFSFVKSLIEEVNMKKYYTVVILTEYVNEELNSLKETIERRITFSTNIIQVLMEEIEKINKVFQSNHLKGNTTKKILTQHHNLN